MSSDRREMVSQTDSTGWAVARQHVGRGGTSHPLCWTGCITAGAGIGGKWGAPLMVLMGSKECLIGTQMSREKGKINPFSSLPTKTWHEGLRE